MSTPAPSTTLSVAEFAALLGVSEETVRQGVRTGALPGYVVGRTFVIPRLAVERFLAGEWRREDAPVRRRVEMVRPFVYRVLPDSVAAD